MAWWTATEHKREPMMKPALLTMMVKRRPYFSWMPPPKREAMRPPTQKEETAKPLLNVKVSFDHGIYVNLVTEETYQRAVFIGKQSGRPFAATWPIPFSQM